MFRLFKSEKIVKEEPRKEGYKIVPYRDEGFIIEKHEYYFGSIKRSILNDQVSSMFSPTNDSLMEDNVFLNACNNYYLRGTIRVLKTKDDAKKIIDEFIDKENEEKRISDEYRAKVAKFAAENPPEWYP